MVHTLRPERWRYVGALSVDAALLAAPLPLNSLWAQLHDELLPSSSHIVVMYFGVILLQLILASLFSQSFGSLLLDIAIIDIRSGERASPYRGIILRWGIGFSVMIIVVASTLVLGSALGLGLTFIEQSACGVALFFVLDQLPARFIDGSSFRDHLSATTLGRIPSHFPLMRSTEGQSVRK